MTTRSTATTSACSASQAARRDCKPEPTGGSSTFPSSKGPHPTASGSSEFSGASSSAPRSKSSHRRDLWPSVTPAPPQLAVEKAQGVPEVPFHLGQGDLLDAGDLLELQPPEVAQLDQVRQPGLGFGEPHQGLVEGEEGRGIPAGTDMPKLWARVYPTPLAGRQAPAETINLRSSHPQEAKERPWIGPGGPETGVADEDPHDLATSASFRTH